MENENHPVGSALVIVAALVIVFAAIKSSADLIVPFLLALFIAIVCNPLISWMTRYHIPRVVAVFTLLTLIVLIGMSLTSVVASSLTEFSQNMPAIRAKFQDQAAEVTAILANFNISVSRQQILELFDPSSAMSVASNMLTGLGGVLTNAFMILLTSLFMLFEAPYVPKKIHLALSDPEMKLAEIDRFLASVNHYLAIKTAVSLATGFAIAILLWLIGMKYIVLFGVLAFMLNYIPTIGSIIAAVPAIIIAAVQFGVTEALAVAVSFLAVNVIMGNVIEPKIMGRGLGISTLVVFLSLVFWGWLLGSVGMLLSVPLTMVVKIALEGSPKLRRLAYLLGDVTEAEKEIKAIKQN